MEKFDGCREPNTRKSPCNNNNFILKIIAHGCTSMVLKFTDILSILFIFIYLSFNTFGKEYPDETVLYYQVPLAMREGNFKVPSLKFKTRPSIIFWRNKIAVLYKQQNFNGSQILLCSHLRLSRLVKGFQYTCIFCYCCGIYSL